MPGLKGLRTICVLCLLPFRREKGQEAGTTLTGMIVSRADLEVRTPHLAPTSFPFSF